MTERFDPGSDMGLSYVTNCFIKYRDDDSNITLFDSREGRAVVRLDGYAILPLPDYLKLCEVAQINPIEFLHERGREQVHGRVRY